MWTPPVLPIQTSPWCRGGADECWTDDQMVPVCPSNPKKGWKSRYMVTIFQTFLMIPNYPQKKGFFVSAHVSNVFRWLSHGKTSHLAAHLGCFRTRSCGPRLPVPQKRKPQNWNFWWGIIEENESWIWYSKYGKQGRSNSYIYIYILTGTIMIY